MKRSNIYSLLILSGVLATGPAGADSWKEFLDQRLVSRTGRTYVVLRQDGGSCKFELCERRPGATPMKPAQAPDSYGQGSSKDEPIDRDSRDRLLAVGVLSQLPLSVRVLDNPPGIVLFEEYGSVGWGEVLSYVNGEGEVTVRKSFHEFNFTGPFSRTVSSLWWYQGFLVDETRQRVFLVAKGDEIAGVSLEDGTIFRPDDDTLIELLGESTEVDRQLALEVAGRLKPKGLLPAAMEIATATCEPLPLRLRAAVAVKRAGGEGSFDRLFVNAVEQQNPVPVRAYATEHLPEILGMGSAVPMLQSLLRRKDDREIHYSVQRAFVFLGESALPSLVEMLSREGEPSYYPRYAARALGDIGSRKAVDALLNATVTTDDYQLANTAVNAAIQIGHPELGKKLARVLEQGSTQDSRIAMYFREHPADYAKKPLEKALKRNPSSESILEALQVFPNFEK